MENGRKRVVITGMGAVTPLGDSIDAYWASLKKGESGIGTMTLADPADYPCKVAGEIPDFDPGKYINPREARRMARFSQTAVAAAALAIEDAELNLSAEDEERMGVVMGNGNGGFPDTEANARTLFNRGGMRISPFFIPMILPNMAAANVSRIFGLKGYTSTVITACAAGTQGIGEAAEAIRRGAADVVLGGGCEAGICQLGLGGFNVIKALSRSEVSPDKASRPFDANRDGFVPAEGAAILVMESLEHAMDRGANILAEVSGYGVSSDAFHAVQPDEDGAGAARAMRWAIENADMHPADIDYINAHGTSTPKNDMVETLAIKKVFGEGAYDVPISSTKSMIGHALGGAGALEAVACVKTIQDGIIHPTINYETADPDCDLDYVPNEARRAQVNTVLSNSFGFGGQNACIVLSKYA
ncbi:MAG: beta-ketoacyl-ACP synthase II [Chloroflexi bacterium]|nr:beta-ketoacyl-ACP synthase II [Chloroflexota bacterium]